MLFPIKEYNLKDTWASPSCYKWTTSFGGPAVNSTYTINTATLPQFSELIERTTAPPQSIFNMVVRCGNPRGRNPLLKKGGRLTTDPDRTHSPLPGPRPGFAGHSELPRTR